MKLLKGGRLVCKRNFIFGGIELIKGKDYIISIKQGPDGKDSVFIGNWWISHGVYLNYFYSQVELRKIKLEKINEKKS